ncbi:MAG TPA: phosphatase PAP2 family protein [Verrucomicrobiae bacterium]|nr:phosphatase PAP2 family protein [Verrucomicrobiae bacterium]
MNSSETRRWSGRKSAAAPIYLPLLALMTLSVVFHFSQLDLNLQRVFWSPTNGWSFANHPLVQLLYRCGTWPAMLVGVTAAAAWVVLIVRKKWPQLRALCLFLVLVLIIGPGLLINAGFKDHFGRSRPVQVNQFGGTEPFRPLGQPGPRGSGKSFPSGHASMGFYWLALSVYFWSRQRNYAVGFAALGILHGTLMGLGRMAQGGHWASDVLWSAGFVYLTAWSLDYFLFRLPKAKSTAPSLSPVTATNSTNILAT